ncbi:non-specific lipid transfer protein GPI-anchored 11-like [Curcuma longa]|uniref:non-specific lipid transfer protein GPI-anchored 11-like n=1 Tax=Curcuma longa TaxID=136217 RepID=UPI003D9E466A
MAFSLPHLLLLLLCFTAGVRVSQASPPLSAPSPSPDCFSEVFDNLIDCLPFVQNGSTVAKPAAQCCSGLRKVVEEAPACLCSLSSQGQGQAQSFGVNVTKALTLPSACGVSTPSASNCNISIAGAPAAAPGASSGSIAGAPGAAPGSISGAPAGAPGLSPSCGAPSSVSGVEFLSGFAVALWLYYQSH